MRQREFGQYCGLARTLEVVGERWALLIVRDLLVRPRRYGELHKGLPAIPTNVLASRLKELEAAGVVERRLLPAPERGVAYALTERGRELEDAVVHLARWGARALGDPRPGEIATEESMVIALRSTFRPERAAGVSATWEVRGGDVVFHARVHDGTLTAGPGPAPDAPDLTITGGAGPPPLRELMAGELTPAAALRSGRLQVTGPRRLLTTFADVFRI